MNEGLAQRGTITMKIKYPLENYCSYLPSFAAEKNVQENYTILGFQYWWQLVEHITFL
jgi:hypothetical protein